MRITREQVIKHLTPPPGIKMPPYPARRDNQYRITLMAITVGVAGESVATLLRSPTAMYWSQAWTALAVVAASWTFLVWLKNWRYLVRVLAVVGLLLWPWWSIGSWAGILAAGAIMAAKETHCFHFPAGRILPWWSLALGIVMVIDPVPIIVAGGWMGLAILWGWLAWSRQQLPLFEI